MVKFKIYQRNDLLIKTTLEEDGEPYKLDGVSIFFVAGKIKKSLDDGIEIIDEDNGEIEIEITSEDTDMSNGLYTYELMIRDVEDRQYTVSQGDFRVKRSYVKELSEWLSE